MEIIVDGHCDTIEKALDNQLSLNDKNLSFNLYDTKKLGVPVIQIMAAYVSPNYEKTFQRANSILKYFYQQKEKFGNQFIQITFKEQMDKVIQEKNVGCVLAIENGSAIEDKLENVDYFYHQGVRLMSVTWNEDNLLGSGALTKNDKGLTEFGKKYIQKLNSKNIIIDVSHSSQKTFWDTCKIAHKNIVATHSCCYRLCQHPRNLTDEQIKQIASMDGIIGICYCTKFLSKTGIATTKEIADHICYVANLVGVDYVGVGSDFDGLEEDDIPTNLRKISQIENLLYELRKRGFHESEIHKIMGKNWIRILKKI